MLRCSTMMLEGEEVPIDDNLRQKFKAACKTLAANGERVLGFVDKDLDKSQFPRGFAFSTEGKLLQCIISKCQISSSIYYKCLIVPLSSFLVVVRISNSNDKPKIYTSYFCRRTSKWWTQFPPWWTEICWIDEVKIIIFGGISLFLSSLIDPPKATVPNAVSQCRSAGISVSQVQILANIYL